MGKRSSFERKPRDFYPTPAVAVAPLLPRIKDIEFFDEPCAGDGALIDILEATGAKCRAALDIEPMRDDIDCADALSIDKCFSDAFITNPPWDRGILHRLIIHLSSLAPTWLLFDADWAHTKQAIPYLDRCRKIVSVGRVKWIPDSKMTGKDNCAWHLFQSGARSAPIEFYGRN
jgi:hypothetical protein